MSPDTSPQIGEKLIVRRGRVDSVDLYEVKENELELLEKGSPANLQLNFSIFLLSLAFSSIIALATATAKQPITETIFVFVAVVGILLGMYLLISWWRTRTSIAGMVKKIRQRIPPEVLSEKPRPDPAARVSGDEEPSG